MFAIWYAVVSSLLIVYVALDGRNFGAGMLHWVVARTPEERRQVIAAIGPQSCRRRLSAGPWSCRRAPPVRRPESP